MATEFRLGKYYLYIADGEARSDQFEVEHNGVSYKGGVEGNDRVTEQNRRLGIDAGATVSVYFKKPDQYKGTNVSLTCTLQEKKKGFKVKGDLPVSIKVYDTANQEMGKKNLLN